MKKLICTLFAAVTILPAMAFSDDSPIDGTWSDGCYETAVKPFKSAQRFWRFGNYDEKTKIGSFDADIVYHDSENCQDVDKKPNYQKDKFWLELDNETSGVYKFNYLIGADESVLSYSRLKIVPATEKEDSHVLMGTFSEGHDGSSEEKRHINFHPLKLLKVGSED